MPCILTAVLAGAHCQWRCPLPACRVTAVGSNWIEFERAVPYDLRKKWKVGRSACSSSDWIHSVQVCTECQPVEKMHSPPDTVHCPVCLPAPLQPVVHAFQATVQHSGFEDFTVEFPWSKCLVPLTAGCSCWPDGPAQLHCWQRSTGHGAAL